MAGFGMILGGAMSGWSDAKLDEIKAQREERLKELEAQRQDKRAADEMKFRHDEAEIGRNFDAGQNDKALAARSAEAQKARDASGDLITDDQGNSYSRTGSTAKPLVDDQGKPIKLATTGQGKFEIDRRYQMLRAAGVDEKKAAKIAAGEKMPSELDIADLVEKQLGTEGFGKNSFGSPSDDDLEKIRARRAELTTNYQKMFGMGGEGDTQQQDSGGASTVIPSDPAKRVIGKTYTNKNGQQAIWKGNGWEIVQ